MVFRYLNRGNVDFLDSEIDLSLIDNLELNWCHQHFDGLFIADLLTCN